MIADILEESLKETLDLDLEISQRKGVVASDMEDLICKAPIKKKVNIGLIGIGFELHFDWDKAKQSYAEAVAQTKGAIGE